MKKIKASEIFTKEEIAQIKPFIDMFKGTIVKVWDKDGIIFDRTLDTDKQTCYS